MTVTDGGRTGIVVVDDGIGMTPEELRLAVERHATSKLASDDLLDIATLGFRGEALPSIGAVSRLSLTSRTGDAAAAWTLSVEGGTVGDMAPAAHPPGTRIEVRDLFYATPARLKFLKTERTEFGHAVDAVKRLALAHPGIAFSVGDGSREVVRAGGPPGRSVSPPASTDWGRSLAGTSWRTRSPSGPSATVSRCPATRACPRSIGATPGCSSCS